MPAPRVQWITFFLLLIGTTGCGNGNEDKAEVVTKPKEIEAKVDVATWDQLQQKIADQKGKVVVLDMWASW